MSQLIEAYGQLLEFPKDMSDDDIAAAIRANEADLNPDYVTPEEGFIDKVKDEAKNFAQNSLGVNMGVDTTPRGFSGLLNSVDRGVVNTGRMIGATIDTVTKNLTGVEEAAQAASDDYENKAPVELKGLDADLSEINRDQDALSQIGDTLSAAGRNPMGTSQLIAEQTPNTAVSLGGGYAGFKVGAAAGAIGGPAGAAIGGTLGFLSGMFLGNALIETGAKAIEKAEGGFTEDERGEALKEGLIKSGVITGVDAATLKIGGMVTKSLGSSATRAGARAEAQVLMKAGVDMTSTATINAALRANPALHRSAVAAGEKAAQQSMSRSSKTGIVGTGLALETAGEGVGEYVGEYAATGEADVVDATIEALAGLTQSSIETAYNYNKIGGDISIEDASNAAREINDERTRQGLEEIGQAQTADEAIAAAQETVAQKPVSTDDVLKAVDPTLADIEKLTGLKPSEAIEQAEIEAQNNLAAQISAEQISQPQPGVLNEQENQEANKTAQSSGVLNQTEIVLPDNTSLPAQWQIVDADQITASIKEGVNQPRDRTRASSDIQIQGIAKQPDYRRLSDSPVMDVGAPVLSSEGSIVAGNGRFEGISQAYSQGTHKDYLRTLANDAVTKGIDLSVMAGMKKPVLVRRITQPFDTRKLAVASNSGTSLQYSPLETAKIDSGRMKGLSDLEVTESGDIALTPKNIQNLKHSLGDYSATEIAALVDKNGALSQEGVRRVRNSMLASAYGNSETLGRIIESTGEDSRNILGALTRSAGVVSKVNADIKAGAIPKELDITSDLVDSVEILSQLKSKGQPLENYLSQSSLVDDGISDTSKEIMQFLHDNIRSQKRMTAFIKTLYETISKVDQTADNIFGDNSVPSKEEIIDNAKHATKATEDLFTDSKAGQENGQKPSANVSNAKSDGSSEESEVKFSRSPEERLKDRERTKKLQRLLTKDGHDLTVKASDVRLFTVHDGRRESEADGAEQIAKIFKKRIVWISVEGEFDINGVVHPRIPDTIFLNIKTNRAAHAVIGHELSHHLEFDNPKLYWDMAEALDPYLQDLDGYAELKGIDSDNTRAIIIEMIGDIVGDNFTKQEFWNKVAKQNPSAFERIAKAIISWLKNLALKAKTRGLGSEQWVTDVNKAQDIVAKAVAQYAGGVQEATSDSSTAKAQKIISEAQKDYQKHEKGMVSDMQEGRLERVKERFEANRKAKSRVAELIKLGKVDAIMAGDRYLLSKDPGGKHKWRITSFQNGEPTGHSERSDVKELVDDFFADAVDHKWKVVSSSEAKFSFAGQRAKTADDMALNTALDRLYIDKEDADVVRRETGWFRGSDDKWRFEINDSDASLIESNINKLDVGSRSMGFLSDVLDHPHLFAAYPAIRDTLTTISIDPKNKNTGSFNAGTKGNEYEFGLDPEIKIKAKDMEGALSTLLHEIQHNIQTVEGFASGGNLSTVVDLPSEAMAEMALVEKELKNAVRLKDSGKFIYESSSIEEIINAGSEPKPIKEWAANIAKGGEKSINEFLNSTPWAQYQRLAGEVEARNVQKRQKLTAEERQDTPITDTQDTSDEDVIIMFNGKVMEHRIIDNSTQQSGFNFDQEGDTGQPAADDGRPTDQEMGGLFGSGRSLELKDIAEEINSKPEKPQTETEKPQAVSQKPQAGNIEDFGEKIGGAKKDVWASYKDKATSSLEEDVTSVPLSKSWPEPDYQALLDNGADPFAVAFAHAVRDEIPTKPKKGYKLSRWVDSVEMFRDVTYRLIDGDLSVQVAKERLKKNDSLEKWASRLELYELVGHAKSLKGVHFSMGVYSYYDGKKQEPHKIVWAVEKDAKATAFGNWPTQFATGDTKQEMLDAFKEKYASLEFTKPNSKEIKFNIYRYRNKPDWYVGKKVGRNMIDLERFDTVAEAREYKATHQDELVAKLAKMKEIPFERRDTNDPRVGEDMRNGLDVTPELFADTFGFRGVEFGNYVESKKRQDDLNESFDALMDMAAILAIPPKAISLNGELGLAFGARGSGGKGAAVAHYEHGKVVINLTKKSGAGSLGHEWWHALDNYFSRLRSKKEDFLTEARDVDVTSRGHKSMMDPIIRKEMIGAFAEVVKSIKNTALKARSSKLDGKRTKDYWTTGREMSARAFESYLIAKLQDQDASNDYLANIIAEDTWIASEKLGMDLDDSYPYPMAGEMPQIRAGFDHFFNTVQHKETDKGVALFSRTGGWRDFPDAIIAHRTARDNPSYEAAKNGDFDAAIEFADDMVTDDYINNIKENIEGDDPIIVPVRSTESSGNINAIPEAVGMKIAASLGLEFDENEIRQQERVGRTGASGWHRIANQPTFSGDVEPGRNYILVDDTLAQGGTMAQLKEYVETNGGKVILATALTGKNYSAKIALSNNLLLQLREKHGALESWFKESFGFGFEGLTESEARFIVSAKGLSTDQVRERIIGAKLKGADSDVSGKEESRFKFSKEPLKKQAIQQPLTETTTETKQPEKAKESELPEDTTFRKFQRGAQDKFNRFTVIKEFLAKQGINLSEQADVYAAEERYHSKVSNQTEDFREHFRNPLIEKISEAGFTMADIADYLEAQHAEEANAAIQELHSDPTITAYGITDKEARAYLAKADKKLGKLANEFREITEKTKQLRLDSGLLTNEIVDAWEATYKHYIPVKGGDESKGGKGKGLKVNFKSKRRLGHGKRDEAVIENILLDHERAIMEVEKNRVGKHIVMMAAEAGRDDLITIERPEKRKVLTNDTSYAVMLKGKTTQVFQSKEAAQQYRKMLPGVMKGVTLSDMTVDKITDPRVAYNASPMLADNEINVYINGHAIRVQIQDELMAEAYGNLGVEGLGKILSAGRTLNSFLSKVYTGYNPEFILTNIIRDFSTGIINLTGEEGMAMAAKAVSNYPKAFSSLLGYAATNGKKSDKWIDAYRENGGNTGAAYLSDMERLGNEVATEYAAYQGVISNLKQGDAANAARAAGKKTFNATLKWIQNLNQAGENAMRLAAFRAMMESDKTVNEAAHVAKNITVNFNRKGNVGSEINAAYLFFNASVQGVAATSHALFKGKHKYQAWALATSMASLGYLVSAAFGGGDEDDYDKIDPYTKERNVLINTEDGFIKIPIPYGYGFFWNFGRTMADAQRKDEWGNAPWHIAASGIEELTPFGDIVGGSDDGFDDAQFWLGAMPTAIKIPKQVSENRSAFSGSPLRPESPFDESQPDREKMWRGTQGTIYDITAGWLETAMGMDVSPETLKHYTRTMTGGAGALVDTTVSSALLMKEGASLEAREIPFIRKLYGELTISNDRSAYYKAADEAKEAAQEFSRAKRDRDLKKISDIVSDKKEMLALHKRANKLQAFIRVSRDRQDEIRLSDKYTVKEKRLKLKELEAKEAELYDKYLDVFKVKKQAMRDRLK